MTDEDDGREEYDDGREEYADGREEYADGREEYADWSLPGADELDGDESEDEEGWDPPPMMREPLFRDRIRDRLGLTPRQWFVLETFLLVAPYPLFVLVYFTYGVDQTLFLVVTLIYSLIAMYVGLLS